MADIPVPRSYQQILGDTADAFISRTGISALKVGSPILSLMEAVAQSQLRDSEDIFTLLNSISLDRATGTALDSIASDEGLVRISAAPSFGYVTFTDSTAGFAKVESFLADPVAIGATTLSVPETSNFLVGDFVIIDKGSDSVEGGSTGTSIQITAVASSSSGVNGTITVSPPLSYPHPERTPILKRQGGVRQINAGTAIGQTIVFNTVASAVIEDGETTVENVPVVCSISGTQTNVAANSITTVNSTVPFNASVTNPLPFINGIDQETDASLRDRIRIARQTRQRATGLAIRSAVNNLTSEDERKRIVSTSLIDTGLGKASLYIDDGTGYEAKTSSIALETVCYAASGGEQYFELQGGKPVAKAFVQSGEASPFKIASGESIEVLIGGIPYTHTFQATDFVDPSKATAYEVVESINANSSLGFYATTSENRIKVRLIAKTDINETIAVINQDLAFSFSSVPSSTLYLFKNNQILVKDGKEAFAISNDVGSWNPIPSTTTSVTFVYRIDGADSDISVTITDADFATNTVSYSSIYQGYLDTKAWAAVLNKKIVGARFEEDGNRITMFSNRGRSDDAKISIISAGNSLVALGMFSPQTSLGVTSDYSLNRSKGQIYLTAPLKDGDVLVAGSVDIRAPLTSSAMLPFTFGGATFDALWFVSDDANATVVETTLKSGNSVTVTHPAATGLTPQLMTITATSGAFDNVQVGDWVIIFDTSLGIPFSSDPKSFIKRVYSVTSSAFSVVEDISPSPIPNASYTLSQDCGIVFVRTSSIPQNVVIGAYSGYPDLESKINAQLDGMHCDVSSSGYVSFYSNSYKENGGLILVAANRNALTAFGWTGASRSELTVNNPQDYDQSISSEIETSVPLFQSVLASTDPSSDPTLLGRISVFTHAGDGALSEQSAFSSLYLNTTDYRETLNDPYFTTTDYRSIYTGYHISDTDTISFFLDGDQVNKTYSGLLSVSGTVNSSGVIALDSGVTPSAYFGGRSLEDWALWIDQATATPVSEFLGGGATNLTFKSTTYGPNCLVKKVQYVYPTAPNQAATAFVKAIQDWNSAGLTQPYATIPNGIVSVRLPSGAEKVFGNQNQVLSLKNGSSPSNTQRLEAVFGGELNSVPPATTYNAIFYTSDSSGYPYISTQITIGSSLKIILSSGATVDAVVTVAPYSISPTQYQFEFSPGLPATTTPTTIKFVVGTNGVTLTSNYKFSSMAVDDLMNVPTNTLYISAGSYRVSAVDSNFEWIDLVTGFTASSVAFRTDPGGAFPASAVKFFPLGTTPITSLEDESLITVQNVTTLPVVRSTEEYFNFLTSAIDSDGFVNSSTSLDFVSTCSTTTYAITTKNGASFTSGTKIKLIPVTAKNVVDSINSFVNSITVRAEVSDREENRVELTRTEQGSDKSLQMLNSGSNKADFDSTGIVEYELGFDPYSFDRPAPDPSYALSVAKDAINPFVVGNMVKLASKQIKTVAQGTAGNIAMSSGTLTSTTNLWNIWADAFSPSSNPYLAESLKWSVKKVGNFALYKLVGNTVTNASISNFRTLINIVNPVGCFVKIKDFSYEVSNVAGLKIQISDFNKAFNQISTNDVVYVNGVAKTVSSTAVDGFNLTDISGVSTGQLITGASSATLNANSGLFRVAGIYAPSDDNICFWVENPDAVDGILTLSTVFLGRSSTIVGDSVFVSNFSSTVTDLPWSFSSLASSYLSTIKEITINSTSTLTYNNVALQHKRTDVESAYGLIESLIPIPSQPDVIGLVIENFLADSYQWLDADSLKKGCVISACNKLNFSLTDVAKSADAYDYYTGLIGEANRVIYGDNQEPLIYPGYAAATANIEVLPPQIRRIQVQITVRMQGGFSITDSLNAIRSAAATAILSTPIGQDVAFSDIVAAVNGVPGVFSAYVTYLSPQTTYNAQNTVINVQANEKPIVVDPQQDIQVTFVGV